MFFEIPTWKVEWGRVEGRHGLSFRVPETELEAFLRVLLFNGVQDISLYVEPRFAALTASQSSV